MTSFGAKQIVEDGFMSTFKYIIIYMDTLNYHKTYKKAERLIVKSSVLTKCFVLYLLIKRII